MCITASPGEQITVTVPYDPNNLARLLIEKYVKGEITSGFFSLGGLTGRIGEIIAEGVELSEIISDWFSGGTTDIYPQPGS